MRNFFDALRRTAPLVWVKAGIRRADDFMSAALRSANLVSSKLVLFEVRNLFGFAAQAPILRELINRGRLSLEVSSETVESEELKRLLEYHGIPQHLVRSPTNARHRRYSLIVLTDSPKINVWRTSRRFFVHHGSSFGNLANPFSVGMIEQGFADYVGCLSVEEEKQLLRLMGDDIRGRLVLVGAPKLDALVSGHYDRALFLESLGLRGDRKTVLLSSHWTPHSLFRSCEIEALSEFLSNLDINLLVTAHYSLFDKTNERFSGGIDWEVRLRTLFTGSNTRVLTQTTDNRQLMWASDLFIGDHSSQHVEYAALLRPMIIFENPDTPLGDSTHQTLLSRCAHVVGSVTDIPDMVNEALATQQIDRSARERFLDYCFAYLGRSGIQAAEAIESIVLSGGRPMRASTSP